MTQCFTQLKRDEHEVATRKEELQYFYIFEDIEIIEIPCHFYIFEIIEILN